jgi:BirA family biotin operon repressor/biotin-[acetyl-CoA-carboxylase] ligase
MDCDFLGKGINSAPDPFVTLIMLDPKKIKIKFPDKIEIIILEHTDSTNNYFKTYQPSKKMCCCFSEVQTQGRGRLNRTWHSPFGKNIYLSSYYLFQKNMHELSGLSIVIGLAIAKTLRQLGLKDELSVKWPNDLLHNSKKIAGILIDVRIKSDEFTEAVIGIGLNVNMLPDKKFSSPEELDQPWTSISEALGKIILDRNIVASELIKQLYLYIQRFEQKGLNDFLKEWQAIDHLKGKKVTLDVSGNLITGIAEGINEEGHLLLRLENGEVRNFSSGDAFLKKK